MERADVDGISLEYEVSGRGEPVVLIHGALVAEAFRPLLGEPSLTDRYQLINYHRRGYAGSTHTSGPVSVARQAADCRGLLCHLGVEHAHVVGHSYGGAVALQLVLDFPEAVNSLVLLEPALFGGSTGQAYRDALVRAMQRYREAGATVVVDEFLRARWPGYRDHLELVLPGAFAQAVTDAAVSFEGELPGLLDWRCGEAELRRITKPVLSVLGGESDTLWSRFGAVHQLLLTTLPHVEGFILPGATHLLQVQNPRGTAQALAAFFVHHPLPTRRPDTPDRG